MVKGLVNVLIPAYNSEHLIQRILDSILAQDYPSIKVDVMNDGSTDGTQCVLESYKPLFEKRGFGLALHMQKNVGLAQTINNLLKYVDGEYFVWPDTDDWYSSQSAISKLVDLLDGTPDDVVISRCAVEMVDEEDLHTIYVRYPQPETFPVDYFRRSVLEDESFFFVPGTYMCKAKFLDDFIPNRDIFINQYGGQNMQILWPYLFYGKCVATQEVLYKYLIRKQSHSRNLFKDLDKRLQQKAEVYNTVESVMDSLQGLDGKLKGEVLHHWQQVKAKSSFFLGVEYGDPVTVKRFFPQISDATLFQRLTYYSFVCPGGGLSLFKKVEFIYNIYRALKKSVGRVIRSVSKFLPFLLVFSLLINFLFVVLYVNPKVVRKYHDIVARVSHSSDSELESNIIQYNDHIMEIDEVDYYVPCGDIETDFRSAFNSTPYVWQYGEYGYFLYYALQHTLDTGDERRYAELKDYFDSNILPHLSVIERTDQSSYGMVAL